MLTWLIYKCRLLLAKQYSGLRRSRVDLRMHYFITLWEEVQASGDLS